MSASASDLLEQDAHLGTGGSEAIHRVETIKASGRTFAQCGCGHVWEVLPGGSIECPIEDIWADFGEDVKRIALDRDRRLANRRLLAQVDRLALKLAGDGSW